MCHGLVHTVHASLLCQQKNSARAFLFFGDSCCIAKALNSMPACIHLSSFWCAFVRRPLVQICRSLLYVYQAFLPRGQGLFCDLQSIHLSAFLCILFLWTQDMCLVKRNMDCIAPCMRPIYHLKRRLPHAKSPTVQRCDTN